LHVNNPPYLVSSIYVLCATIKRHGFPDLPRYCAWIASRSCRLQIRLEKIRSAHGIHSHVIAIKWSVLSNLVRGFDGGPEVEFVDQNGTLLLIGRVVVGAAQKELVVSVTYCTR
jgi:hypothetical protein